jgi:hydrogenase expression/formation protein HypE
MSIKFLPGKLPLDFLEKLLAEHPQRDPRVVVGPRVGEDAAVIDLGSHYLVVKSDPITFVADSIGFYAVQVNANDIATMGARPRWFLATILLPERKADEAMAEGIFRDLWAACDALDISLVGGHTEITIDIDRPIIAGSMLGEVSKERLITTAGARVGDHILLTKGIAIEATSIIAREKENELLRAHPPELIQRARNYIYDPGISVVRDALTAVGLGRVHAMHDPTEGGLSSGLYEMALAGRIGLEIQQDSIHILPESSLLLAEYDLDPLGAIASGALLLAVHPDDAQTILEGLVQKGIPTFAIGRAVEFHCGVVLIEGERKIHMPRFARDEIARLFES